MKVTVWNESRENSVYPGGMNECIKSFLLREGIEEVRCATLEEEENGLPDSLLADTDVLIWWGHCHHDRVSEETVNRVIKHVNCGMGIIFLHSAHNSKPFKRLMGTSCTLKWREAAERERLWVASPSHPIAKGIPECVVIENEEMYGEYFDIPQPDEVVFIGWFKGGEVFRSGCTFKRGHGKVFYFQPGHETYPVYNNEYIQKIITNAVRWANPDIRVKGLSCPNVTAQENL